MNFTSILQRGFNHLLIVITVIIIHFTFHLILFLINHQPSHRTYKCVLQHQLFISFAQIEIDVCHENRNHYRLVSPANIKMKSETKFPFPIRQKLVEWNRNFVFAHIPQLYDKFSNIFMREMIPFNNLTSMFFSSNEVDILAFFFFMG